MNTRITRSLLGLTLALVVIAPASAGEVEIAPGVFADSADKRVYLSNPSGFPEARALEDGRLLWAGDEPALLLARVENGWLALGHAGRYGWGMLLVINADTGKVQDRIAFDLPESVSAAVGAEPLRRFDVRAENLGSDVRLHWSYAARPLRGALLIEDGSAIASEGIQLEGVVDVRIDGSRTLALPRLDITALPLRASPDLAPSQRIDGLGDRQFRSADDSHVMAVEARSDDTFGTVWRWHLASRSEGLLETTLDQPFALAPFLMLEEGRLLLQAPPMGYTKASGAWEQHGLRLVMHDLAEGRELWSVELLDREFRGVLPP
jgi:hypothetical protein